MFFRFLSSQLFNKNCTTEQIVWAEEKRKRKKSKRMNERMKYGKLVKSFFFLWKQTTREGAVKRLQNYAAASCNRRTTRGDCTILQHDAYLFLEATVQLLLLSANNNTYRDKHRKKSKNFIWSISVWFFWATNSGIIPLLQTDVHRIRQTYFRLSCSDTIDDTS